MLTRHPRMHGMAELAGSVRELEELVGALGSEARRKELRNLRLDTFLFVPAYCAVLWTIAGVLASRAFDGARALGVTAGLAVLAGAIFDQLENARARQLLARAIEETSDADVAAMRRASLVKWALLFSAFALLAPLYFAVGEWRLVVGVAFAVTAAVGLARLGDQLPIQAIFMGMLVVGLAGLGAALALIA
jgi:hypothetical protein